MSQPILQEELIVDKSQLLEIFKSGIKPKEDFRIGVELEKLGVHPESFKAVPYSGKKGVLSFLKELKKQCGCDYIFEEDSVIGLNNCGFITLEPGSQLEYSTLPEKGINDLANQINDYNRTTSDIAKDFGFYWIGYGIQPLSVNQQIELIPKKRYSIMTDYLPKKAEKPLVMMRETAGIQVAVDYCSEEDFSKKFKTALALSPVVTAMFANSPVREGKDSGYKSYRALAWLSTDNDRCGFVSKKIFDKNYDFSFEDYANILLNLPMMFLKKDNNWLNMKGLSFKEYIKSGYEGYRATVEDWLLHLTSYFPDVRLKNYLEIRNMDSQRQDLLFAAPALWKGIMYNEQAMDAAYALVADLTWEELNELREQVPKNALGTKIRNKKLAEIAKELVDISYSSLKDLNCKEEAIYLEPLMKLLKEKKTPADMILERWHGEWNKDLTKLIEYSRLK